MSLTATMRMPYPLAPWYREDIPEYMQVTGIRYIILMALFPEERILSYWATMDFLLTG